MKKKKIIKKKKSWLSFFVVLTLAVGITFALLGYRPQNLLSKSSSNSQSIASVVNSVNSFTMVRGSCPVASGYTGTYSSVQYNCNDGYSTTYSNGCQTAQQLATYVENSCANRIVATPTPTIKVPSPTTTTAKTLCPNLPGDGSHNYCMNGSSCPSGYRVYGSATNNACGAGQVCCNRMDVTTPTPTKSFGPTPTPTVSYYASPTPTASGSISCAGTVNGKTFVCTSTQCSYYGFASIPAGNGYCQTKIKGKPNCCQY